jgi:WD40 repeat protein
MRALSVPHSFLPCLLCVSLPLWFNSSSARAQEVPGVRAVAFSPDGKLLAAGTGLREEPGLVVVWDVAARRPAWVHPEATGVCSVAFAPDGKTLATEPQLRQAARESPSAEVRIRARRLRQEMLRKPRATLRGHGDAVEAVAFSPDGTLLASGSKDGTVRLWDGAGGKEVARLVPPGKGAGAP